ncbi:response regulator transcription factor [Candidatus Kuenenbacteria bacterium]|nr:response regulator transcription factor [Candidatus Kuenenbacteria bacterium]
MSRLPTEIKEKSFDLRIKGYSVKEIADKLHIAESTSSLWVRSIKLNREAEQRLKERKLLKYYKSSLSWQKKRAESKKQFKVLALKTINKIKKDPNHLKIYCALLYWCEGGKNDKEAVRFINSDPALIKTFIGLFRKVFQVDEKKFCILLHVHEYHDEEKQKNFWSSLTKIPKKQFFKVFYKQHTKKRIREGYPGCVAIYYYNIKIARELRMLSKVFSEQLGAW